MPAEGTGRVLAPRAARRRVAGAGSGHHWPVPRRGLIRRLLPVAVPVSRAGMAWWAWRNRTQLMDWAGFASRSVPRLQGEGRGDVITEARLRARLSNDPRTRSAEGLRVDVSDGVATLSGIVTPEVHDAALAVATDTRGIRRVRDTLRDKSRRNRPSRRSGATT